MRSAHTPEQVRAAEASVAAELREGALMQLAASALAARCSRLLGGTYGRRIVALVGSGNNGGDALYAAAALARRGAQATAVVVGERVHEPGLAALTAAGGRTTSVDELAGLLPDTDLILDGMLGIGGRGGLRGTAGQATELVGASNTFVVAVDVPSGVDAETGEVAGAAVRADVTITFGTYKPGLLVDPGAELAGVIDLVDIGLTGNLPAPTVEALQEADVAARLPELGGELDKYRRGVLGIVAGSETYAGAAVLTTGAGLRTGVGMVRFVSSPAPAMAVRLAWPEAVVTEKRGREVLDAGRVQAWAVGPGLGTDDDAADVVAALLGTDLPVVVDADGLTVLARRPDLVRDRTAPTVLTPHAGELSRLLDADREDIEARRLTHALQAAERFGAVVLLKGSTSVIATPDGQARVNPTGTPVLATAGTGDVLTGAIGALLATGLGAYDAASVGAYLHGRAARRASGGGPILAGDVVAALPGVLSAIRNVGPA